jgi:hypothetical protein
MPRKRHGWGCMLLDHLVQAFKCSVPIQYGMISLTHYLKLAISNFSTNCRSPDLGRKALRDCTTISTDNEERWSKDGQF